MSAEAPHPSMSRETAIKTIASTILGAETHLPALFTRTLRKKDGTVRTNKKGKPVTVTNDGNLFTARGLAEVAHESQNDSRYGSLFAGSLFPIAARLVRHISSRETEIGLEADELVDKEAIREALGVLAIEADFVGTAPMAEVTEDGRVLYYCPTPTEPAQTPNRQAKVVQPPAPAPTPLVSDLVPSAAA